MFYTYTIGALLACSSFTRDVGIRYVMGYMGVGSIGCHPLMSVGSKKRCTNGALYMTHHKSLKKRGTIKVHHFLSPCTYTRYWN